MSTLIELFTQLAHIDSVSGEEKNISDFIVQYLQNLGLTPMQDPHNMVYCRIGNQPNPLLFCAHMDTVEPGRSIQVVEKDGFLRSAGNTIIGGDNKVAVAAILYAVTQCIQQKKDINVELLFSVREETDSGVQQVDTSLLQSKVGFVFDGGGTDLGWVVTQASTIQDVKIEIRGTSTHASTPELGINALEILMSLKDSIKLGRVNEQTTFNLGIIRGGDATNTIPGSIRIEGDLRSMNTNMFQEVKQTIEQAFACAVKHFDATVEFKWIPYSFGYSLSEQSEAYQQLSQLYKKIGISLNPVSTTGGSDAGFLNSIGIETFCLGDGVLDVHTPDERIAVKDFECLSVCVMDIMREFRY